VIGAAGPVATYDGQAAIRLEARAGRAVSCADELPYTSTVDDQKIVIDWAPAFHAALAKLDALGTESLALAFHQALAEAAVEMLCYGADLTGCRTVAFSGGVFMNQLLVSRLKYLVEKTGLTPLFHRLTRS